MQAPIVAIPQSQPQPSFWRIVPRRDDPNRTISNHNRRFRLGSPIGGSAMEDVAGPPLVSGHRSCVSRDGRRSGARRLPGGYRRRCASAHDFAAQRVMLVLVLATRAARRSALLSIRSSPATMLHCCRASRNGLQCSAWLLATFSIVWLAGGSVSLPCTLDAWNMDHGASSSVPTHVTGRSVVSFVHWVLMTSREGSHARRQEEGHGLGFGQKVGFSWVGVVVGGTIGACKNPLIL